MIEQSHPLLQMVLGRSHCPQIIEDDPQAKVSLRQVVGILHMLRHVEELLRALPCRLEHAPGHIQTAQATQHQEALRGLPHLLAEFPRASVRLLHFRAPLALVMPQGPAQGDAQRQFVPEALTRVPHGGKQISPPGDMRKRFHIS